MYLDEFIKKNKEKKFLNYTIDKKFAIIFDDKKIILFKCINSEFKEKNYFLVYDLNEENKFKKWNKVNEKILTEKARTDLLYLTSEVIN